MGRGSRLLSLVVLAVAPIVFALLAVAPTAAATDVPGGVVALNTTWDVPGSPYVVLDNLTVDANATLSVAAGVTVRVAEGAAITVAGAMQAQGTAASPVIFEGNGSQVRWNGLVFEANAGATLLDNTTVRYAAVAVTVRSPLAMVALRNVLIFNTTTNAIYVETTSARADLDRVTLDDNPFGVILLLSDNISIRSLTSRNSTRLYPGFDPSAVFADRSSNIGLRGLQAVGAALVFSECSAVTVEESAIMDGGMALLHAIDFSGGGGLALSNVSAESTERPIVIYSPGTASLSNVSVRPAQASPMWIGVDLFGLAQAHVTRLSARDAELGLRAGYSALVLDNSSFSSAGLEVGNQSRFIVDNVSLAGGVFALDGYGTPAVVKNCNLTGGAQFNIAYREVYPAGTFDVDLRLGNRVNGEPVLAFYHDPQPAAATAGGPYAFVYVFGTDGVRLDGATFGTGANRSVWFVNSSGGMVANTSIPRGLWARNADGLRLDNVSVQIGVFVEDTDGVSISDARIWGGPRFLEGAIQLQDVVNATLRRAWVRANDSLALFGVNGGVGNLVVEDSTFEGLSGSSYDAFTVWASGPVRINNTTVCNLWPYGYALQIHYRESLLVSNLTICEGSNGAWFSGNDLFVLEDSRFEGLAVGVDAESTAQAVIRRNVFANSEYGLRAGFQDLVYENEFWNNTRHALGEFATWYNATLRRGNFWDNYAGVDANNDGIGDTPYTVIQSARDMFPLIAPPSDSPPSAVAAFPAAVDEDTLVLFEGSGSSDNLGIAAASWAIVHRGVRHDLVGLDVSFTFDDPGLATVTLTVSDVWGQRRTASGTVLVRDRTPPTIETHAAMVVNEDTAVTIAVNASDANPAWPALAQFSWRLFGGWQNESFAPNGSSPLTWTFVTPGRWTVSVNVSDPDGNFALSSFEVTVRDVTPPSYSLSISPSVGIEERATVTLTVNNLTDEDPAFAASALLSCQAQGPGGPLGASNATPWAFVVPAPGTFVVNCAVTDPSGNVVLQSLSFAAADAFAPVWTPPATLAVRDGEAVTLSAADAQDSSGIAFALWKEGANTLGVGLSVEVSFAAPGRHTVTLLLEDAFGHSSEYEIVVEVADMSPPRLAQAGFNLTREVAAGARVTLDPRTAFADNDPNFSGDGTFVWEALYGTLVSSSAALDPVFNATFPDVGIVVARLHVQDPSGNELRIDFRFEVIDRTPPQNLLGAVRQAPSGGWKVGDAVGFDASATDAQGAVVFNWDFGDGKTGMGPSVTHTYARPGNYTVTLRASDGSSNVASTTLNLTVTEVDVAPASSAPDMVVPLGLAAAAIAAVGLGLALRRRGRGRKPSPDART